MERRVHMIAWFERDDCPRNSLSRNYGGGNKDWITGCSVRDRGSNLHSRIRKCTFCAGPEGIILLLSCLVRQGGCLIAGTRITMADGRPRNIEDVKAGDRVKACVVDSESILDAVVQRVARHPREEMGDYYLLLDGTLGITPYHPMYANGDWIPAGGLMEGDVLLTETGTRPVGSIEVVYERVPVFDLLLEGPIAYLADGIVVPTKIGFVSHFKGIGSRIRTVRGRSVFGSGRVVSGEGSG